MQVTDGAIESIGKAAGWLDRLPIAGVAVLALCALAWVFRLYIRDGQEHRTEVKALNEKHAEELKAVNDARLRLATEFEGTIRALLIAAKAKRREKPRRPDSSPGERKE